jgi:Tfp pilus assembly protein FimT
MFNKALSLVEMIISLAITAVLTGTVLVSLTLVEGRKLDTQARNLLSDLSWVRETAATQHYNYTVVFDTAGDTYSIYNSSVAPANLIKSKKLMVNLVSINDWNNNPIPLSRFTFFYPKGNTSDQVSITLEQNKRTRRLNISDETGFIKMEQ